MASSRALLLAGAVVGGGFLLWSKAKQRARSRGFDRKEMNSGNLLGSVKPYQTHIFVGLGEESASAWPAKVEKTRVGGLWAEAVKRVKTKVVKITAFDGPVGQVLVFPNRVEYNLTAEECNVDVLESIVRKWSGAKRQTDDGAPLPKSRVFSQRYIFVCSHTQRDARCGFCGPILVDAFQRELRAQGILPNSTHVHKCSHVGGHRYAGNVLVFAPRDITEDEVKVSAGAIPAVITGDWYGYVRPSVVSTLVRHIVGGTVHWPLWRGAMGLSRSAVEKLQDVVDSAKKSEAGCGGSCPCANVA